MRPALLAVLFLLPSCVHHHHHPAQAQSAASPRPDPSECAPLLPAPDELAVETEVPTHSHEPLPASSEDPNPDKPVVIAHQDLKEFGNAGNTLVGLATRSLGAREFEVWRSQIAPGGATPPHVHSSQEIFVVLRGKGELRVGTEVIPFEAPATVIAPAGIEHQLKNTGDVPTDQIVIVALDSEIKDTGGQVMTLPWRK